MRFVSFCEIVMESGLFTREENLNFGKNLLLVTFFFFITPVTLVISLFSLFSLTTSANTHATLKQINQGSVFSGVQVYASLPASLPSVSGEVGVGDARVEIVKQYLTFYNSPIISYAEYLVKTADKYGLDYRLLPAIAQQESNLCKLIPPESHNCWGWGIHSQGSLGFQSYEESIETVAKGLKTEYIDKGYRTVPEIMSKYTPNSPEGAWAKGVSQFMAAMQ
jgi:hypothetical protein